MGIGCLALLLLVFIVYMMGSREEFKERHEDFIKGFVSDFSQNWNVADVSDLLTNEALESLLDEKGKRVLLQFSSFGKLIEIRDFEIGKYSANADGKTVAEFSFKADFENVKSLVKIILHENSDKPAIHFLYIEPISEITAPLKTEV